MPAVIAVEVVSRTGHACVRDAAAKSQPGDGRDHGASPAGRRRRADGDASGSGQNLAHDQDPVTDTPMTCRARYRGRWACSGFSVARPFARGIGNSGIGRVIMVDVALPTIAAPAGQQSQQPTRVPSVTLRLRCMAIGDIRHDGVATGEVDFAPF